MSFPNPPSSPVILPDPLRYLPSPNQSERTHGIIPYLIVVHRPVGSYGPSISWLRNPQAQVSSHIITEGNTTGVDVATQLVPWHRKAWAAASFNSAGYQLEIDDDAWNGHDYGAFFTAARICGFICRRTGIPPRWSRSPLTQPGIVRHYDLGIAGGGHTDPTLNVPLWEWFIRQCLREYTRGEYRTTWGTGTFVPLPS